MSPIWIGVLDLNQSVPDRRPVPVVVPVMTPAGSTMPGEPDAASSWKVYGLLLGFQIPVRPRIRSTFDEDSSGSDPKDRIVGSHVESPTLVLSHGPEIVGNVVVHVRSQDG